MKVFYGAVALAIFFGVRIPGPVYCAPPAEALKAAAVLGLSGSAAYHAQAIRRGLEMAAKELETEGWDVRLKFEDDQTNPAKTASAMHFLLSRGYRFFIGPTWSFQVNAVRAILASKDAVALVPAGSSEINGGAIEGVFNLCPPRTKQQHPVAAWLKEKGYKKGFVLTPNGDWGEVHREVFEGALKEAGASLVGRENFDYGVDSAVLRTILLKAKRVGADAVLITGAASDAANIVHARNLLHLDYAIMSTNDVRDALEMGLLSAGDIASKVYAVGLTVPPEFRERFRAEFGEEPGIYADRGYEALKILALAVEKTDGSPKAVKSFLRGELSLGGVADGIRFDENGDITSGSYQLIDLSAQAAPADSILLRQAAAVSP